MFETNFLLTNSFSFLLNSILFLDGLFSDMALVLKLFTFLAIIGYVKNHMGVNILSIMIVLGMAWLILLDNFMIFGGVYVLYVLSAFGFTGVIIDFFFVKPQPNPGEQQEGGVGNGKDYLARQNQIMQMMGKR
ncbi:MAG: hypothetical protein PHQ98_03265 [Candidatus ainarchaeum sp.]|nr:hypothetical protein [Candidatus ainarchaeum sp.]